MAGARPRRAVFACGHDAATAACSELPVKHPFHSPTHPQPHVHHQGFELDVGNRDRNGGWEPEANINDGELVEAWRARDKGAAHASVAQDAADAALARTRWAPRMARA